MDDNPFLEDQNMVDVGLFKGSKPNRTRIVLSSGTAGTKV